jgi:hypothetical protein
MNCTVCSFPLPDGARACPQCGSLVSGDSSVSFNSFTAAASYNQEGQQQHGNTFPPTVASSGSGQQPISSYGIDPYNMSSSPFTGYNSTNQAPPPPSPVSNPPSSPGLQQYPYGGSPSAPGFQPPPQRSRWNILILGIVIVLVVLLIGEGIFLLVSSRSTTINPPTTPTPKAQVTPSPTVDTQKNPYPPRTGALVLNDPMHNNSKGYKWDESTIYDDDGKGKSVCGFSENAYHVSRTSAGALICAPEEPNLVFTNLAYEINLTQVQGENVGVVVHLDQTNGTGYLFAMDTESNYSLSAMNLNAKNDKDVYKPLRQGTNSAIKKGLKQKNLVAIVANEGTISVHVNNVFVDSIQDKTFNTGQIGIYVYGDKGSDLVAGDARVWKI